MKSRIVCTKTLQVDLGEPISARCQGPACKGIAFDTHQKNWNLAQLYIHHQMPGQLSTVTAKVSCQWVILSPRRRAKIECWQLSLGRSKVPKDIENALEKEMDKLQSTTEASRALNSVIWCLKPLVCFWFEVPVAKVCTCAGRYRKGLGKRDGQDAVDDGGRVGIQFCCWV